jgi:succinyl-CoA synthetase beta subunit
MRLHEFEAKEILKKYKIPFAEGMLVQDAKDIDKLTQEYFPAILKAQVLVGGRGKAGGILTAETRDDAKAKIQKLLGMKIKGYNVESVLVEKKVDVEDELYVAVTIDRLEHRIAIITSEMGGINVEQIAEKYQEKIVKYYVDVDETIHPYVGRSLAKRIGLKGKQLIKVGGIIHSLFKAFKEFDGTLIEINPLAITKNNEVIALDAVFNIDTDALYRHPKLAEMGIKPRHEVGELTEREKIAREANFPYVDLEGDIGVFPGGAGFGIAAVDLIHHFGGKPANFMDSGGGPTVERMEQMIGLLMDNPKVKVIFGARFGGISRCDLWAEAIISYLKKRHADGKQIKPMVMRMAGNMEKEGRELFEKAKKDEPQLFKVVKIYAYNTPIEEVIKETIRTAEKMRG